MSSSARRRMTGIGRVLVAVYAIMALAALGRSFVQIAQRFDEAPVAYSLSALSAAVYVLATLALVFAGIFATVGTALTGSLFAYGRAERITVASAKALALAEGALDGAVSKLN